MEFNFTPTSWRSTKYEETGRFLNNLASQAKRAIKIDSDISMEWDSNNPQSNNNVKGSDIINMEEVRKKMEEFKLSTKTPNTDDCYMKSEFGMANLFCCFWRNNQQIVFKFTLIRTLICSLTTLFFDLDPIYKNKWDVEKAKQSMKKKIMK